MKNFLPQFALCLLLLSFSFAFSSEEKTIAHEDSLVKMERLNELSKAAKSVRTSMDRDSIVSVRDIAEKSAEVRSMDSARIVDSLRAAGYDSEITTFLDGYNARVEPVFAPIVAGEIIGQDAFVWMWDRYVLGKNYAHIGPSIWKRNFREGWKWDHNHWAINFYGHPYQGSMYYAAARAGGYGFYSSVLWAALGSSVWEMFCETEYPAPNDLITTSVSGSMYGEVLYRLSRLAYNRYEVPWYRHVAAFALSPAGYAQRRVFGNRDFKTVWVPVELEVALGGGSRFGSEYRIGSHGSDNLDEKWNDHHGMAMVRLEYGRPYAIVKEPFDYFNVEFFNETGFEGNVAKLDIMGKLKNVGIHGRGHWLDFSANLDFDTYYGDIATISTLSLGGAIDIALWATPDLRFRLMNQLYAILLGTADMGYDDLIREVHPDYVSDKDNYQYNTGVKYSLMMEILYKNRMKFFDKVNVSALHTIPGSVPHYGAEGWDILVMNQLAAEYRLCSWIDLGSRLDTYLKIAAYSTDLFEPMSRSIFTFSTYLNFHLLSGS